MKYPIWCATDLQNTPGRNRQLQAKGAEDFIRLAFNENPLGPAPQVIEAVESALYAPYATVGINRYGDFNQTQLCHDIAAFHGVKPAEVTVAVGSSEVLNILAAGFLRPGDELITADPTFNILEVRAAQWGASVTRIPLDAKGAYDLSAIVGATKRQTKMIYLCNPNNPTGTFLEKSVVETFLDQVWRKNPRIIVVLDEAYIHYTDPAHRLDALAWIKKGRPLVVVRSFSKAYGMAGLRVGYALANRRITQTLTGFLHIPGGPYGLGWAHPEVGVSRLAEAGVLAALTSGEEHLIQSKTLADEGKELLAEGVSALGCDFIPSYANFMMIDTKIPGDIVSAGMCERGILIQSGASYHARYNTWIRVSIGTAPQIQTFLSALNVILDDPPSEDSQACMGNAPFRF